MYQVILERKSVDDQKVEKTKQWKVLEKEDPGTPMGLAITKRYLTTDSELCQQFVDWLNRLFNDDQPK